MHKEGEYREAGYMIQEAYVVHIRGGHGEDSRRRDVPLDNSG